MSAKHSSRRAAPFLALLALLAAVPRPGFYAHHHAGDVAGHVHASPAATAAPHHHDHVHVATPRHSDVAHHAHSHGNAHSHAVTHSHDGAEADADAALLFAGAAHEARDHWHSQAPFQHAAASHAHVVTQVDRVESVATTPTRIAPADAPPTARSRGPPLPALAH